MLASLAGRDPSARVGFVRTHARTLREGALVPLEAAGVRGAERAGARRCSMRSRRSRPWIILLLAIGAAWLAAATPGLAALPKGPGGGADPQERAIVVRLAPGVDAEQLRSKAEAHGAHFDRALAHGKLARIR